jgi:hypothetical protein
MNPPQLLLLSLSVAAGLLSSSVLVTADDEKSKPAVAAAEDQDADEKIALDFAREHHPELARLLEPMKKAHPKEYQKAVRELARTSERLARVKPRFPERFAIEIDLWKAESRLRLVAAKSAMVDDEERRQQIEELVEKRNTLKIRLFEEERKEALAKVDQLDRQIAGLKSQQGKEVRAEVDKLVKSAQSTASRVKTKQQKPTEESLIKEAPKDTKPKRPAEKSGATN